MTDRHRTVASRLDDDDPEVPEPVGPEPREPSDNQTLSSPVNELENRLFGQRKVLVFGAITDKVARDVIRTPADWLGGRADSGRERLVVC